MSRNGRGCSHSAVSDMESFLLVGALLWLALASLRWLFQRPKLWPVVALLIYAASR